MAANAASADGDGDDITSLQLVGHAVRTCLSVVGEKVPRALVGLLSFSTDIHVITAPVQLDGNLVRSLSAQVDLLHAEGVTNMWGAISQGLAMAQDMTRRGCAYVDVFLFTDGLPTESTSPPEGIAKALKVKYPHGIDGTGLHTFGFGPNIDSDLLLAVAQVGNGIFKYVSDPGMVGTALINSVSKFIIDCNRNNPASPRLEEVPILGELIRYQMSNGIHLDQMRKILADGMAAIGNHPLALDREQIQIALSQENYLKTWGVHYFRTLLSSHAHKHCGNFKDPGLQGYADAEFQRLQGEVEDIFKTIDPPKGSAIKNMDAYVNPYGGCWSTAGMVRMADGTLKQAGLVRVGDVVATGSGSHATVTFIMINHNPRDLVQIGDLVITAWHPLRVAGVWLFAGQHPLATTNITARTAGVVSFMLSTPSANHSVVVDGVECITLGHGLVGNPVVEHEFYGNPDLVDHLKQLQHEQHHQVVV